MEISPGPNDPLDGVEMKGMATARHWGIAWDWSFGALEERGQMTNIERVMSDLPRGIREVGHDP